MKTSNRTLFGFGIGIAALIVITIVLVITLGQRNATLLDENTPQGIVQRYLLAVQEKNYPAAYNYLVIVPDPVNVKGPLSSYDNWVQSAQYSANSTWKANLGKVNITGDTASVVVLIDTFRPGGPFGNPVSTNTTTFFLKKTGTGWLITSPIDLYWLY